MGLFGRSSGVFFHPGMQGKFWDHTVPGVESESLWLEVFFCGRVSHIGKNPVSPDFQTNPKENVATSNLLLDFPQRICNLGLEI